MKAAHHKKSKHPNDSVVIQLGVAFIVVVGFALLIYSMQHFLP